LLPQLRSYSLAGVRVTTNGIGVNSEGKTPSDGRRIPSDALPPLLGRGMKPRPATKGAAPPWNPLQAAPRGKPRGMIAARQIVCAQDSAF